MLFYAKLKDAQILAKNIQNNLTLSFFWFPSNNSWILLAIFIKHWTLTLKGMTFNNNQSKKGIMGTIRSCGFLCILTYTARMMGYFRLG